MMSYEDALKAWGARKLYGTPRKNPVTIDLNTVSVSMNFDEGYACCGGRDPDCYCSFAESPSADVTVSGRGDDGREYTYKIEHYSFDFAEILGEIVEAGGGVIASEVITTALNDEE